ncbi:MAG: hypothetical protein ACLQGP_12530 [Isosphaeraceae bacterium]
MSVIAMARQLLFGAALLVPALAMAQPPGGPNDGPPPGRGRPGGPGGGPGEDGPRHPVPPIMAALDTNRDGRLSPEEIRNAVAAIQSLDHNQDGILDRSELEPRGGPGGPDGPPDGPPRGGRFGGPAPGGPDGPPGGRPPGAGRGRPEIGHVLPPFVRAQLTLTERQTKQIADLENVVKGKLESILTPRQLRQVRDALNRGPGGRGPGGPGGRGPGGPPDDEDDAPPVRPQRPRQ